MQDMEGRETYNGNMNTGLTIGRKVLYCEGIQRTTGRIIQRQNIDYAKIFSRDPEGLVYSEDQETVDQKYAPSPIMSVLQS